MQKSILYIILGLLFLLLGIGDINTTSLTVGAIFLICGLFMYKKYENKTVFVGVTSAVLVLMSIITYLQITNPNYTGSLFYNGTFFVLMILAGLFIIYKFPQNWRL